MIGKSLGHYTVVELLGAGGMGEVYRARDTRLGREVAIKVLPDAVAGDAERLARFEQEARLLAALNHPNIASLHGLEEMGGFLCLVMELVPGETLAGRLKAGPLPVEEALEACRQIAEALEGAHERGIVHRDLKPANVKVTPEGRVKVLDFGLAKVLAPMEVSPGSPSESPTATHQATQGGRILGTAAYMSPEQARGKPMDRRTDAWSFGCVLYETLTGRQAFEGETVSDTIAAILGKEPDWSLLPGSLPAVIPSLLRRCLRKDLQHRIHDIADARIEIGEALADLRGSPAPSVTAPPRERSGGWRRALLFGLAGLIAGGVAAWTLRRPPSAIGERPVTRFVIQMPDRELLASRSHPPLALSPDGTRLVYAVNRGFGTQLYLRTLNELKATPIPGTEDGFSPFFSPDGQWLGFFTARGIKKVMLPGGTPVSVSSSLLGSRGGAWGADGTVVFTPALDAGLSRVAADGGEPRPLTSPDAAKEEISHRWPQILPGRKGVLFTVETSGSRSFDEARIAALTPETGTWKTLIEGGMCGRYAPTGHLVYARAGKLLAVAFDLERLEAVGNPVVVLEDLLTDPSTGAAHFSFSGDGSLVYVPGGPNVQDRTLVWVDRRGIGAPVTPIRRAYAWPRFSPNGQRLAITIEAAEDDVWLYEMARGTLTRLTFGQGDNAAPVWAPDGTRISYSSQRRGATSIFSKAFDGSGAAEPLLSGDDVAFPSSWSADRRALAYTTVHPSTGMDIWLLPLDGEGKPQPFLVSPFDEIGPMFSPDGRWLAYVSNESGRNEVYVQPVSGQGPKWQISGEGGSEPLWSSDGRELFFRSGNKMMAVSLAQGKRFGADKPRVLFEGWYENAGDGLQPNYDITPDGSRFVMIKVDEASVPTQIHVVLNWFEELERRVRPARN